MPAPHADEPAPAPVALDAAPEDLTERTDVEPDGPDIPGGTDGPSGPGSPDGPDGPSGPDGDGPAESSGPARPLREVLLHRLLGPALRLDATPTARLWGWLGPLLVTALAGVLRFVDLDRPHKLVFDETYYVKQAYTLLRVGYEARWPDTPNPAFEAGNVDTYLSSADYVVHPQVGKWLIAIGEQIFGGASSFGWRFSAALLGTAAVWMLARIARRMFGSTLLGTLAGLLLAIDGEALVQSRISLLDVFVMFFGLAAFGALLLDREQARRRLAERTAAIVGAGGELGWGPRLGWRWWRLAAGILLGLMCGTKWSGIWFLAAFGLLTVGWDMAARRAVGVREWARAGAFRDGVVAFLALVPVAFATYLASWFSWFLTPGSYLRDWAATHPGEGVTWLPESLRSLWHYHQQMWQFHTTLHAEHPYKSNPFGWLLQLRPTSFFYETPTPAEQACGASSCSQAITSLGNPIIWWGGTLALGYALYAIGRSRDWKAVAIVVGVAAGWFPWLIYAHRTIFTFYTVAFVPFVVLAAVYGLSAILGDDETPPERRRLRQGVVAGLVVLACVVSAFFYPIWTAQVVSYDFWHAHMWLASWI